MVVIYAVVPYLSVVALFTVFQRMLLYRPTVADDLCLSSVGFDKDFGRDVKLETPDGCTLRGWLVYGRGHQHQPLPLVLYFAGNSLNRHERVQDLREVAAMGYDVLIFDYRGYGDSTGAPSEAALTRDARSIWKFAYEAMKYAPDRTVILGESLGGAVALSLWAQDNISSPQPAGLILSSTFASLPDSVAWHYPWFPFRYVVLDRWPSVDRIGNVDVPVVVFHGTDDSMVPASHGITLAHASQHANFIEVPAGTHNEIPGQLLRTVLQNLSGQAPHTQ